MALTIVHCCATLTIIHLSKVSLSSTWTLSPLNTSSPFPPPPPLASTNVLPDSMNLTLQGTLHKWNQTVFVCTYCILEHIFLKLINILQTVCTFFFLPPVLCSRLSLVMYFIHSSVFYVNSNLPIYSHYFLHLVFIHLFSVCLYFCFANRFICTIFSRFHIYALIYSICFSFSDLLYFVWQSLGSSSLKMAQFCSFPS